MKYEKSCGCIVMNDKKEILLVQSINGHWGMPKGHIEEGETEVQTAIREVKEETNIDVVVNEDYRYVEEYSPKEDIWKEVVYFLAKNKNANSHPQQEEISELIWLPMHKAIEKITYDNSKEIVRRLKKDLEERGGF